MTLEQAIAQQLRRSQDRWDEASAASITTWPAETAHGLDWFDYAAGDIVRLLVQRGILGPVHQEAH